MLAGLVISALSVLGLGLETAYFGGYYDIYDCSDKSKECEDPWQTKLTVEIILFITLGVLSQEKVRIGLESDRLN